MKESYSARHREKDCWCGDNSHEHVIFVKNMYRSGWYYLDKLIWYYVSEPFILLGLIVDPILPFPKSDSEKRNESREEKK